MLAGYEQTGAVAHPAGEASVAWITRSDIAAFALDVLLDTSLCDRTLNVVPPAAMPLRGADPASVRSFTSDRTDWATFDG